MSLIKPSGKRALDRILDPAYVQDLPSLTMQQVRQRRQEASHEEAWLSYVRRMLHGRIDILEGNGVITADGELDLAALVASLSGQMGPGQYQMTPDVVDSPGGGRRAVERLIASSGLDDPAQMTARQVQDRLAQLRDMEREVSQARNAVHDVLDTLSAEVARRYRDAQQDPAGHPGTDV